jgi:geranylgeranyl pyrophosphate synthase
MQLFNTYHQEKRQLLLEHIHAFFALQISRTSGDLAHAALERLETFTTQGKMLRGVFAIFAYEMYGGVITKDILNVAAAMELSQAGLLIHDDIMDNDTIRRNAPTTYAQYMQDAVTLKIPNSTEYGKSMAMIVGDTAIFLTYELIGNLDTPHHVRSYIMNTYSHEMLKVALGQFMDYNYGQTDAHRTEDEIAEMYHLKTGGYTFTLPFLLGAYCADAPLGDHKHIVDMTSDLGLIFQLKDDEIGILGDHTKTGKKPGSDIREGKKTLLMSKLYEKASKDDKQFLDSLIGVEDQSTPLIRVQSMLKEYGVIDEVHNTIQSKTRSAHEHASQLHIDTSFESILRELIDYNAQREI